MTEQFQPKLEFRDPTTLTPYANNAKIHTTEQVDKIAGQIAKFGFDQPIVIQPNGVIIKGHGRREASLRLGLKQVPVIVQNLDEYEAMAARIADNKVALSDFDTDKLKFDLGTLDRQEIDLGMTGLDEEELDLYLGDLGDIGNLNGDSSAAQDMANDLGPADANHVRMVQLFLDETTHPEFLELTASAQTKLGTTNLTDTVLEIVRAHAATQKPNES